MISNEKIEKLNEIFNADKERTEKLFSLESEQALKEINSSGNSFTLEEIKEYASILNSLHNKDKQLDDSDLDNVSGGIVFYPPLLSPFPKLPFPIWS